MKSETILCIITALGIHAGALTLHLPAGTQPPVVEIEVGLESGGEESAQEVRVAETTEPEQPPKEEVKQADPVPPPPVISEAPKPQELPVPPETPADKPVEPPQPVPVAQTSPPSPPKPQEKAIAAAATGKKSENNQRSRGTTAARSAGSGSGRGSGSSALAARYLFRAPLRYPSAEWSRRIGGVTLLTVEINESGRAVGVELKRSSGNASLDAAAIQCARQSRYEPVRINGLAQSCRVDAPFQFVPGRS